MRIWLFLASCRCHHQSSVGTSWLLCQTRTQTHTLTLNTYFLVVTTKRTNVGLHPLQRKSLIHQAVVTGSRIGVSSGKQKTQSSWKILITIFFSSVFFSKMDQHKLLLQLGVCMGNVLWSYSELPDGQILWIHVTWPVICLVKTVQ